MYPQTADAKDNLAAAANDIKLKVTYRALNLNDVDVIPTFTFTRQQEMKPQLDPHSDTSVLEGVQAGCEGVVGYGFWTCAWSGCAGG